MLSSALRSSRIENWSRPPISNRTEPARVIPPPKHSEIDRLPYHDPKIPAIDHAAISDDDAHILFRNREATALFAWSPYMYDPKLASRLHRIRIPTLVLWGASDRIVSPDYGRAYSKLIAGAQFELIEDAGHYPHIERPDLFTRKIVEFVAHAPTRAT